MRPGSVVLGVVALALSSTGDAQVQGVCVSGCYIPNPPQQASPQDPDVRPQYLMGFTADVRGDVTFTYPSGRQVKAGAGERTPIVLGTRVTTGPSGRVQFLLLDETSFTVGPNSEMIMDEFAYDASQGMKKVSARVLKGLFRFVTGKVVRKDPDVLKVKLAVGDLGFRGTDVEIEASPDGSGSVRLYEGEAVLEEYDSGKTYTLKPGQSLRFENFQIVGVQ